MNWLDDERRKNPMPLAPAIPDRYTLDWDAAMLPSLRETAMRYLGAFWQEAPNGRGCCFLGKTGTFKTTVLALMARKIHSKAGVEVGWVHGAELALWNTYADGRPEVRRRIAYCKQVPVLVMDDFTEVVRDSFGHKALDAIIVARYDTHRPTLWSGNMVLPQGHEWETVHEHYGPLFARRLRDTSQGYTVIVR
jgi:DNA replication protein DnaC